MKSRANAIMEESTCKISKQSMHLHKFALIHRGRMTRVVLPHPGIINKQTLAQPGSSSITMAGRNEPHIPPNSPAAPRPQRPPNRPYPGSSSGIYPFLITCADIIEVSRAEMIELSSSAVSPSPLSTISSVPSPGPTIEIEDYDTAALAILEQDLPYRITAAPRPTTPLSVRLAIQSTATQSDRFSDDLHQFLNEGNFDESICCQLFLEKWAKKLLGYHKTMDDGLGRFASVVKKSLWASTRIFSKLKSMKGESKDAIVSFINEERIHNPITYHFLDFIATKINYNVSEEMVDKVIDDWKSELNEVTDFYNSYQVSSDEMRRLFERVVNRISLGKDVEYLQSIRNMLRYIIGRKQDVYPFVFMCAPSGSGKSAFAYNFAAYKCPTLYMLYSVSWEQDTQELYSPFQLVTKILKSCLEKDLILLTGISEDITIVSSSSIFDSDTMMSMPLNTVHFIVNMFVNLIQKKDEQKSWMQTQVEIDRISKGRMSIKDGINALKVLNQSEPLVAFFDECVLLRDKDGNIVPRDAAQYVMLRSILRILKCFPFFAGTDARSSNFVGLELFTSCYPDQVNIWAVLISALPQFNVRLLDRLSNIIVEKFPENYMVMSILEFLRSVSTNENPWLIQLALRYLYKIKGDEEPQAVLNDMFLSLHHSFHRRKMTPTQFTRSQLYYIACRRWSGDEFSVLNFQESTINRHFAYLRAVPFITGQPYSFFALSVQTKTAIYWEDLSKESGEKSDSSDQDTSLFEPKGVFASFTDAPLTGFVLFGLNSSVESQRTLIEPPFRDNHDVFINTAHFSRISTLDAVLSHKHNWFSMKGGSFLETLYNAAVIVASRANGPKGSSFTKFIAYFIKELWTAKKSKLRFLAGCPTVDFGDWKGVFDGKVIPFLSPMVVTEWSRTAVNLMKRVTNSDCRLGTFMFATGNERVDHAVLEMDYNDAISDELAQTDPSLGAKPPNKVHNDWVKIDEFSRDRFNRISLVAECKQWRDNLTLEDIEDNIVPKFESLEEVKLLKTILYDDHGHFDEGKECKTFIVMTLSVSKWSNPSAADVERVNSINKKGFYLWTLHRLDVDQNGEPLRNDRYGQYSILPLDRQVRRKANFKDIIIIPLSVIVGKSFTSNLFKFVQENAEDAIPDNELGSICKKVSIEEMLETTNRAQMRGSVGAKKGQEVEDVDDKGKGKKKLRLG